MKKIWTLLLCMIIIVSFSSTAWAVETIESGTSEYYKDFTDCPDYGFYNGIKPVAQTASDDSSVSSYTYDIKDYNKELLGYWDRLEKSEYKLIGDEGDSYGVVSKYVNPTNGNQLELNVYNSFTKLQITLTKGTITSEEVSSTFAGTISNDTLSLYVSGTKKLTVSGYDGDVVWKTSDKSVATVSEEGKVTAKKVGTATITAKCGDNKLKCKVTVKKDNPKISESSAAITVDDTLELTISGTAKKVTWSTSNKSVATVSKKGIVTGKKAGSATITATLSNGTKKTCKLTVKKKESADAKYLKIAKNYLKQSLKFPDTMKLYDAWSYDLSTGYHCIVIEYSAENNFGQTLRKFYYVKFQDGVVKVTEHKTENSTTRSDFLGKNVQHIGI